MEIIENGKEAPGGLTRKLSLGSGYLIIIIKTQRVLDGRLSSAKCVAQEREVDKKKWNGVSNAAKRKRSRGGRESKQEDSDMKVERRRRKILHNNSKSALKYAGVKKLGRNPMRKEMQAATGGTAGSTRRERKITAKRTQQKHRRGAQQRSNPYYYHAQRLQSRFKTEEGHFRVLEMFSKRTGLLQGIENYRFATFEANPKTFVVPHHCDSDAVLVVLNGKGTITAVGQEEKRASHKLERGDVIRVYAGVTVYLINPDDNEKLSVAMLIMPINTPAKFREFFAAGGENPESVYKVFSNDILETALATPIDELDQLLGKQKRGIIIKAPLQHLKALTQHASSAKQRGRGVKDPFNLLDQQPLFSNKFGKFYQASPDDYKQLQDIDISVTYSDLEQGALVLPYYNSRTTTIVLVVEGRGRFELACPHPASQSQSQESGGGGGGGRGRGEEEEEEEEEEETEISGQYQKISSSLSVGNVFIVPAGHPVTVLAFPYEKLRTLAFGITAKNNQKNFLAERENIINKLDREAKELSFNAPAALVEQIFRNQKGSYIVGGPQRREERGGGQSLASVLDQIPPVFL